MASVLAGAFFATPSHGEAATSPIDSPPAVADSARGLAPLRIVYKHQPRAVAMYAGQSHEKMIGVVAIDHGDFNTWCEMPRYRPALNHRST